MVPQESHVFFFGGVALSPEEVDGKIICRYIVSTTSFPATTPFKEANQSIHPIGYAGAQAMLGTTSIAGKL